jgi:hypothetical protein
MRRVTPFIPSSLETCAPPLEGAYVCAPANHVVRGRACPVGAFLGAHMYAPLGRARPIAVVAPRPRATLRMRTPLYRVRPRPCAPLLLCASHYHSCPTRRLYPPFVPHETCSPPIRVPQDMHTPRARPWKPFAPSPCTPLEYKFIKIVVHSTT